MFKYKCKWGWFQCWGDKFLGEYENDRYIVFRVGKLGLHYGLTTHKKEGWLTFGFHLDWNSGLTSRLTLGKWEFSKVIFWTYDWDKE
jgi:hypothetical protein